MKMEKINKITEAKEDKQRFIERFGQELYDRFLKLKPRLTPPDNDISYWMKKSKEDLVLKLDSIEGKQTAKQKSETAKQGSKKLYSDPRWDVIEIQTLEASIKYGKETKWCISGVDCNPKEMWDYYMGGSLAPKFNKDTSVFIFFIDNVNSTKWAVLYDRATKNHIVWNELDNITSFIKDAPKVKGLPNLGKIPFKVKHDIAKSIGVSIDKIKDISETTEEIFTDDHLEKYYVEYYDDSESPEDKQTIKVFRSPDTEEFETF